MNISALIAILFSSLTPLSTVLPKEADQPITKPAGDRVGFTASIDGVETDLSIISTSVMPGETVSLTTSAALTIPDGTPLKTETGWQWIAPETPGHHVLHLRKGGEMMLVNVFVLTPFRNGRDENLNGYRVGQYSDQPLRGLPQYLPPTGFINMQPGMEDIQIAPNFKLGQFICKQQPGHDPTFLLVQAHMLTKLERLLEAANDKGWEADTFYVMSGFRTPFYNAAIGNTTTSSRHLFGDAADIYIDQDGDGVMDDLNGDGKITKADAVALADLAKSIASENKKDWPAGGIGIYDSNAVHGPFVHIDARGYPARWG
ncbi:hypothetical protein [Ponticaulis profundi]|uniref:Peptidase M15A C-terminal domain-containing protein n=1 Tax=Ponticaulis profundi TaxID=2665222 RepID=A0ABW1S7H6_9PROT